MLTTDEKDNHPQKKILVDDHQQPIISGYGFWPVFGSTSSTTSMFSVPIRYSAPEYFSDETGTSALRSIAGDVYALAMIALEVSGCPDPTQSPPTYSSDPERATPFSSSQVGTRRLQISHRWRNASSNGLGPRPIYRPALGAA